MHVLRPACMPFLIKNCNKRKICWPKKKVKTVPSYSSGKHNTQGDFQAVCVQFALLIFMGKANTVLSSTEKFVHGLEKTFNCIVNIPVLLGDYENSKEPTTTSILLICTTFDWTAVFIPSVSGQR